MTGPDGDDVVRRLADGCPTCLLDAFLVIPEPDLTSVHVEIDAFTETCLGILRDESCTRAQGDVMQMILWMAVPPVHLSTDTIARVLQSDLDRWFRDGDESRFATALTEFKHACKQLQQANPLVAAPLHGDEFRTPGGTFGVHRSCEREKALSQRLMRAQVEALCDLVRLRQGGR